MTSTTTRRLATAAGCLAAGALLVAPAGALAAGAGHGTATTKASKPGPKGFYISGEGLVTTVRNPIALVRDNHDGEHVITSQNSAGTPGKGHLLYLTRKRGTKHFTAHAIPGLRPTAGRIQVEEHLSTDGNRVVAVFYECDGVFAADASLTSTRMPEPTLVMAEDNCATATPTSSEPPVADAVASVGRQISVLLPDPKQGNQPALFSGTPGMSDFTPGPAIPTTDDVTVEQITRDSWTGRIVAVGEGTDGTTKGIYVLTKSDFDQAWSEPTRIASLDSATTDYTIESVTSYRNSIWVGLQKPGTTAHPLDVVHGTNSDQWIGAIPLPHSTRQDRSLRLLINPVTGNLHAAFTRVDPAAKVKKSGVMQEARANGKWAKPRFFSHWYRDVAVAITINSAGRAVLGYEQS